MNKQQYKTYLRQRLHEQNADSIDKDPLDPAMRWVANHPYIFMGGAAAVGAAHMVANHLVDKDVATPSDPPSRPPSKRPPQSQWDPEVSAAWDAHEGIPPKLVDATNKSTLHSDPRYVGDEAFKIQSAKDDLARGYKTSLIDDPIRNWRVRTPDVTLPGHLPDVTLPGHLPDVTLPGHLPGVKAKGLGAASLLIGPAIAFGTALFDKKSLAAAGGDAAEAAVNSVDPFVTTTLGSTDVPADVTPEEQKKDMDAANAQREKQANDEAEKTKQNALNDTKNGNNSLNKTITDILSGAAKKNI